MRKIILILTLVFVLLAGVGLNAATPLDDTKAKIAACNKLYEQAFNLMWNLHNSKNADGTPKLSDADYAVANYKAHTYMRAYYNLVDFSGMPVGGYNTDNLKNLANDYAKFMIQKGGDAALPLKQSLAPK